MNNVKFEVKGDKLVIEVNLKERHGLSGSGQTIIIGGTQGNVKIGHGDVAMGLSVYTKEGLVEAQLKRAKEAGFKTWAEYVKAQKEAKSAT